MIFWKVILRKVKFVMDEMLTFEEFINLETNLRGVEDLLNKQAVIAGIPNTRAGITRAFNQICRDIDLIRKKAYPEEYMIHRLENMSEVQKVFCQPIVKESNEE